MDSRDAKLFVATKAFISCRGRVLILRESAKYEEGANSGRYDVVGGRIKPGQRFDESLRREVEEETGLKIAIQEPFFVNEWRPVVKNEQWQIVGIFFRCISESDKVSLSQDHDKFLWIEPKDYKQHSLIENLYPAFDAYLSKGFPN